MSLRQLTMAEETDKLDVDAILNSTSDNVKLHLTDRTVLISNHALLRSTQRQVSLEQVRYIIENGTREQVDGDRLRFTFGGVVVITDPDVATVVTMWPEQGYGVDIDKMVITPEIERNHQSSVRRLSSSSKTWTSHTVAIVDQSGSMRKVDMDAKVMRSDVVWLNLAVTVVYNGLMSGERTSSDVLSVIAMRETSDIVIYAQPFDWILYNKLVDLLRESKPSQGGCYVPAIDVAESLLIQNQCRSCAKTLLFLSDGRPSDKTQPGEYGGYESNMIKYSTARIGKLASQLGQRLNVCCAGIGKSGSDEFRVIKAIADEAKQYGCPTVFQKASLSASVLASTLTRMTTDTTTTMTTISEEVSSPSGTREYRKFTIKPMREVGSDDIAESETWKRVDQKGFEHPTSGRLMRTIVRSEYNKSWVTVPYDDLFHSPGAVGVAFETRWFGEGAERIVKEFREIDALGNFVGPKLVAKDTKFIDKERHKKDHKEFHEIFSKTQNQAQKLAGWFNKALAKVPGVDNSTPRVEFLSCSVYMIEANNDREAYLVEPMLDVSRFKYEKFNDNQGGVIGKENKKKAKAKKEDDVDALTAALGALQMIEEEGDEDEGEESDDEEEDNYDTDSDSSDDQGPLFFGTIPDFYNLATDMSINPMDIPQAFSCYTYHATKKFQMVCDLQGIYNTSRDPPVFELTDPVIHNRKGNRKHKFGRTDRGEEGMSDFLQTHTCSRLCEMLRTRRLKASYQPDFKNQVHPIRFSH